MKKISQAIELCWLILLCSGIVTFVVIATLFDVFREMIWPTEEEKRWRKEREENIKKWQGGYYGPK